MKKIILTFLMCISITCFARPLQAPMASFLILTDDAQDMDSVWSKVSSILMTEGFIFLNNNSDQDKKIFVLKDDQDAIIIMRKNSNKNSEFKFIEVAFLHFVKPAFDIQEYAEYSALKTVIQYSVKDHKIEDSIPFMLGK